MTRQEHIELVAREIENMRKAFRPPQSPNDIDIAAAIAALERAGAYVGEK